MNFKYVLVFTCCYDCKRLQQVKFIKEDYQSYIFYYFTDMVADVYDYSSYCYVYDYKSGNLIKEGIIGDLIHEE